MCVNYPTYFQSIESPFCSYVQSVKQLQEFELFDSKIPTLKKNDLYEIIITHVATISEFNIQLAAHKELLSGLNLDLKFHYEKKLSTVNHQNLK